MDVSTNNQFDTEKARLQTQFESVYGRNGTVAMGLSSIAQAAAAEAAADVQETAVVAAVNPGVILGLPLKVWAIGGVIAVVLLSGAAALLHRWDPGGGLRQAKELAAQLNVNGDGTVVDEGGCPGTLSISSKPCHRGVYLPLSSQQEMDQVLAQLKGQGWTAKNAEALDQRQTRTTYTSSNSNGICIQTTTTASVGSTNNGTYELWVEAPSDARCVGI